MSIEEILGIRPGSNVRRGDAITGHKKRRLEFSIMFFSDVRTNISDTEKYQFMKDLTIFGDQEGFKAVYMPERHFGDFGSIYSNPAITASYLIPQTKNIRFRTAGIVLPLHHPAEIVEWWSMNDILSNGRVDLGFASGWSPTDFILSPDNYENRKEVMQEKIDQVKKLWRGEKLRFQGADDKALPILTQPRPLQSEIDIWTLVLNSESGFQYAGEQGLNVFTMLQGSSLNGLKEKIAVYRNARKCAGLEPEAGTVTLMLHTFLDKNRDDAVAMVKGPLTDYIGTSMKAHIDSMASNGGLNETVEDADKEKILAYSVERYIKTASLIGGVKDACEMLNLVVEAGVNEVALLMDFGVDYAKVIENLHYIKNMLSEFTVTSGSKN